MRSEWGLLFVIPFLMLVHALPHLPNADGLGPADVTEPSEAYYELARRANDAPQGTDYPYPVHADEHIHLAWMAQIIRQETADIDDPYSGGKETEDLFTVSGMRSERGWNVAIVQLSLLTDVPLIALARFLPAIWAGFLGVTVWLALRPAPGAVAGAAMVAILPTTLRFLGIGFLVPSSFALPWVIITLLVASKLNGAQRFFGLLLLITAAHFMHLVLGMLCIGMAIAGTLVRGESLGRRITMLGAALVPLVWILPTTYRDAQSAISSEHTLPFIETIFTHAGFWLYPLAAIGAVMAFMQPSWNNRPHRAAALLAIPLTISLFLSIINDHRNDATYSRIIFAYFLVYGILASYALGKGIPWLLDQSGRLLQRWKPGMPSLARPGLAMASIAIAMALFLPTALANHMEESYYRIHDDESWAAAERLDDLSLSSEDVILSEPWAGPLYSSVTGARLAVVFTPSGGPANGDWGYFTRTDGATREWLTERGITYTIGHAPNAPHDDLGSGVYRLRPA